eukprot:scaffold22481_cov115-Amphora_coffeaeformis.AAC.1
METISLGATLLLLFTGGGGLTTVGLADFVAEVAPMTASSVSNSAVVTGSGNVGDGVGTDVATELTNATSCSRGACGTTGGEGSGGS